MVDGSTHSDARARQQRGCRVNPFFTNVVLKRLKSARTPDQQAEPTPRWAVALTWVLVLAALALVSWLLFELSRVSAH